MSLNPIEWINSVVQLRKEMPLPIHSFFAPPMPQVLPREVTGSSPSESDVWAACYGLENLSDRVLRQIVIKLPRKPLYDPVVETAPGMTLRKWEYDEATREIRITAVDPQEAIYITLFPRPEDCRDFSKPKVLIGDRLLTTGMQRQAYYKRHPKEAFLLVTMSILMVSILAFSGYAVYTTHKTASNSEFIQETLEPYSTCRFVVLRGNEIAERRLRGSFFGPEELTRINRAAKFEELFTRKRVVTCERMPPD